MPSANTHLAIPLVGIVDRNLLNSTIEQPQKAQITVNCLQSRLGNITDSPRGRLEGNSAVLGQ